MYADGNTENPRTVAESYAGAISSGSTKVGNDSSLRTSGDVIAAAGMSPYRMGMALMRLVSEWQSGATPPNSAEVPDAKALAREAAVARVESGIQASEEEYGGMCVSDKRARRAAAPVLKHEAEMAQAGARQLAARSANWHMHEHKLRFQRLKTLPAVRDALMHWVLERDWVEQGYQQVQQLVADTLRHFLAPVCPVCQGRKRKVIQSRAIGQECKSCRGTGEKDLQHGGRGRALLAHMRQCTGQAASDLREGSQRLRRSAQSTEERKNRRDHEQIERLRRADGVEQDDAKQNTAAIAAHFAQSLGKRREPRRN